MVTYSGFSTSSSSSSSSSSPSSDDLPPPTRPSKSAANSNDGEKRLHGEERMTSPHHRAVPGQWPPCLRHQAHASAAAGVGQREASRREGYHPSRGWIGREAAKAGALGRAFGPPLVGSALEKRGAVGGARTAERRETARPLSYSRRGRRRDEAAAFSRFVYSLALVFARRSEADQTGSSPLHLFFCLLLGRLTKFPTRFLTRRDAGDLRSPLLRISGKERCLVEKALWERS